MRQCSCKPGFIVRYLTIQYSIAQVKILFFDFFPLSAKTALEISQPISDELLPEKLRCDDVGGQDYDNTSTLLGIHRTTNNIIPKTLFVP